MDIKPICCLKEGAVAILRRSGFLAFVVSLAAALPARAAFIITPTFASSITSDANAAAIEATINSAISTYEANFSDPITVNITFQSSNTGLGSSSTFFGTVTYASYLTALTADSKTADDTLALAHLGAGPNNPVNSNANINVKTANLRAIGINANPPSGQPDGTITLNTHITTPGSPGSSLTFNLLPVVEHEIDEVLGLGSALPSPPNSTIFPEDLFRYTSSAGVRTFTTTSSVQAFFSIDGTNDLAQFDNQNDGGDFGDWQSNPLPGGVSPKVQDAFATAGSNPSLGVELRALDVIGYDRVSVPEPAALSGLGITSLMLLVRRRRV